MYIKHKHQVTSKNLSLILIIQISLLFILAHYSFYIIAQDQEYVSKSNSISPSLTLTTATLSSTITNSNLASWLQNQSKLTPSMSGQKVGLAPHERLSCSVLRPTYANQQQQQQQRQTTSLDGRQMFNASSSLIDADASRKQQLDLPARLRQLRALMESNQYDAYLVTPNDEHNSEYVANYDRRLEFISGFTGSNGYALILHDSAVFFSDGRYAIQADKDLDCNWWLVISPEPALEIENWLRVHGLPMANKRGLKIATDARFMSLSLYDYLDGVVRDLNSEFVLISQDLIDVVWNESNVPRELNSIPLHVHPAVFAGNVSWQEKVTKLAEQMAKLNGKHYVVSQLDDIAWLLNLRGSDVPMSPLFKSYLFISRLVPDNQQLLQVPTFTSNNNNADLSLSKQQKLLADSQNGLQQPSVLQVPATQTIRLTLYVDLRKITQQVREHLSVDNVTTFVNYNQNNNLVANSQQQQQQLTRIFVELRDYDVFIMDLREKLTPAVEAHGINGKLLLNANANVAIHVLAKSYDDRLILVLSLINKLKCVKTNDEVNGMRSAHWRDSLAIAMMLSQLDSDIGSKGLTHKWTEVDVVRELEFYRSLMDLNKGQSFDTISAYGSNAAIIHYHPLLSSTQQTNFIGNESTYLLDSGGQYLDGTTDITRTMYFGATPSEFERETYTRVLMGSIDTMSLVFSGARKSAFKIADLIARRHLLELGLDYAHGTGHGIGAYSLVHEQPYLLQPYEQMSSSSSSLKSGKSSSASASASSTAIKAQVHNEPQYIQANMFSSVEPGYYEQGKFGIRIEDIVVTQIMKQPELPIYANKRPATSNNKQEYLRFEPLSLVPYEPKLIKFDLLSNKQKTWLNSYNLMVRLGMTQQINKLLIKIRRYLQAVRQAKRSAENAIPLNDNAPNFVKFGNLEQLQTKLEQTHKWIMSKTELVPLDLPQSLTANSTAFTQQQQQQQQVKQSQQTAPTKTRPENQTGKGSGNFTTSTDENSKRLMLAYMSSLPFADSDAADAAINSLINESEVSNNSTQQSTSIANVTKKACDGLQCDFAVVSSLVPQLNAVLSASANQHHLQTTNINQRQQTNLQPQLQANNISLISDNGGNVRALQKRDDNHATETASEWRDSWQAVSDLFELNNLKSTSAFSEGVGQLSSLAICSIGLAALVALSVVQMGVIVHLCRRTARRELSQEQHGIEI